MEGGWEHPCPTLPLALPSPPRRPASGPTCLAGQSLGFGAETLQVVVAPLFVLLQGTLLFVAPATVVALVGLAHRGRGDCGADRKDTALVTPPCALALQSHGGGGEGRGSSELGLSFLPYLQLQAWTGDHTTEKGASARPREEGGDPGPIAWDCRWASWWPNCCSAEGGARDLVGDHPWQAGWPHPRVSDSQTVV